MQEYDWIWRPNSVMFGPRLFVHEPVFGKQIHQFASPFWEFTLTLPPKAEKDRREIAAFLGETEGIAVVNVYDPRIPVPAYYAQYTDDELLTKRIPELTIKATDKVARTITVSGAADASGDYGRITKDDPIAFTNAGVRHYYRALEDVVLDGTDQAVRVDLRPRVSLTGLSIVLSAQDRIKPTCRFQVFINDTGGRTNVDGYTDFSLRGVEFFGVIDAG